MLVAVVASSISAAAVTYDVALLAVELAVELELVHDAVRRVVDYWLLIIDCQ